MAQTARALFKTVNLNPGTTAITTTGNSAGVALPDCQEAVVILDYTVVTGTTPSLTPVVQASPDGGATWAAATVSAALIAQTAAGRQVAHVTGLGSHTQQLRISSTVSGTTPSFTVVVEAIGLLPADSANVADQI